MTKSLPPKHLVVYADDDQDDLDLVRESFEKYAQNVELVCCQDGEQALEYLSQITQKDLHPCLIILDINLPGMNGKDILQALRAMSHYEHTPVVLFTTSSQPSDKDFAREYRAGFMTKPLSFAQMDLVTDQFIEHCTEDIKKNIRKQIG